MFWIKGYNLNISRTRELIGQTVEFDMMRQFKDMTLVLRLMFQFSSNLRCWVKLTLAKPILYSISISPMLNLFIHPLKYFMCLVFFKFIS